jgi:hypothetical protein
MHFSINSSKKRRAVENQGYVVNSSGIPYSYGFELQPCILFLQSEGLPLTMIFLSAV